MFESYLNVSIYVRLSIMNLFKKKPIFLDYAAGRKNPSALYEEGMLARHVLLEARTSIARMLHVQARDIIFTSGGTESDNMALLGVFEALRQNQVKPHIIISSVEHPAIRECAKEIQRRGGEVSIVSVEEDGGLTAEKVIKEIKAHTILVSIMLVNNETGALHPISRIARLIAEIRKKHGTKLPYFHTDASQAASLLSLDVSRLGVDLMTLDASKVDGPKGVGLLVVRPGVEIRPIMFGGGQERGLRPGTEQVEAVHLFARMLEAAQQRREEVYAHCAALKTIFLEGLHKRVPEAVVNTPQESVPHIISVTLPGKLHEFIAVKLSERGVCVSTGSSCTHLNEEEREALRFSFGRETTKAEVQKAVRLLQEVML